MKAYENGCILDWVQPLIVGLNNTHGDLYKQCDDHGQQNTGQ